MAFEKPHILGGVELDVFLASRPGVQVFDQYQGLLEELCEIRNPSVRDPLLFAPLWAEFLGDHGGADLRAQGSWVFFPWNNKLVHYLPQELHDELRTARNRNIITAEEQKLFRECAVGIAGLSVGSHAALTLAMMGGCNTMKLADPDVVSGSNLNRIRLGFSAVGQRKVDLSAQIIYEMNPYADLHLFPSGISKENFEQFVNVGKRIAVFLEEMDNLGLKIEVRKWARALRIPVLMVTDNADGVIVDVERYDLEPDLPIFAGRLKDIPEGDLAGLGAADKIRIASQIVDVAAIEPRMLASVHEVGKTLNSWPQLATAATTPGVALAYLVKLISLRQKLVSGRTTISFDSLFAHS